MQKNRIAFIVGMPRAATTFLYHNLNRHPALFMPFRRKTNYFSLHHDKGEDWFFSHFKDAPEQAIAIDTETLAFVNRELSSPRLIHAFYPNARVILCVRNPADWVVSLYHQIATFDDRLPSFEEFISGTYTLTEDGVGTTFNMCEGDIYARIQEYQALFPSSILLLKFDEVISAPLSSLRRIEQFLGVHSFFTDKNIITKKINSRDRRHHPLLNKLLRNERLITAIRHLIPRRAVLTVRWIFDCMIATETKKNGAPATGRHEQSTLDRARQHFRSDSAALAAYF